MTEQAPIKLWNARESSIFSPEAKHFSQEISVSRSFLMICHKNNLAYIKGVYEITHQINPMKKW